jgi:hypothetical protein
LVCAAALLAGVLLLAAYAQIRSIKGDLPYTRQMDEAVLLSPAGKIIKTGDLNPGTFLYPSAPVYLAALGLALGYLDAAGQGEIPDPKDLGSLGYPFYTHPGIVFPAKVLFVLSSLAVMLMIGLLAYRFTNSPAVLFLAPAVLASCQFFFYMSCAYINPNILGAFFTTAVLCVMFWSEEEDTFIHKSVLPGLLAGFAVASKYTLVWIFVPPALMILFHSRRNRLLKLTVLLVCVALGYAIAAPFSILHVNLLLKDLGKEIYMYNQGMPGFSAPPGPAQFMFYITSMARDFGSWSALLAAAGLAYGVVLNWRRMVLLLAYPVVTWMYLSNIPTNFTRNNLGSYPIYALLAALGVLGVFALLTKWFPAMRFRRLAVATVVGGLCLLLLPWRQPVQFVRVPADTRNRASTWVFENLPAGSTLLVPEELAFYTKPFEARYQVRVEKFRELDETSFSQLVRELKGPYVFAPLWGYDPRKHYDPEKGKALSERLNRLTKNLQPLLKFSSGKPVMVNYPQPVHLGMPRFTIGRIPMAGQ